MATISDRFVQELLSGRYIASIASGNDDGSIHMVAVWYLSDGGNVYVATSSRTRKARNLRSNGKVSLMIDSRDPAASRGVTITGTAKLLAGAAATEWNDRVHRKYLSDAAMADKKVGEVFAAFDDVSIQITPLSVITWDMREVDRQAFGGAFQSNPKYLLPLER
jgi:PPOX class probable F420-dependent enzyme